MNTENTDLEELILNISKMLDGNKSLDSNLYEDLINEPEMSSRLIDFLNTLSEENFETDLIYSAAILAWDMCIASLYSLRNKQAKFYQEQINHLMLKLAQVINQRKHSINFWLPTINAFYETSIELSPDLAEAYFSLASDEGDEQGYDDNDHLESMRRLIEDLSDLSVFDITENFFAQSYAMPPEFFADLVFDLYSIEEGHDIALLSLLHPNHEVREIVLATVEHIIDDITFSDISLSRLETIRDWYPESFHATFNQWIKIQRKKGVMFSRPKPVDEYKLQASEVDGSGSQGIFIQTKERRKTRLSGLLFNYYEGIRDCWTTPVVPQKEVKKYYHEAFSDNITIRKIDETYFNLFCEHFLAITIENGKVPSLYLLEIQELLGLHLKPNKLNPQQLLEDTGVQISPFTTEEVDAAIKHTKSWTTSKPFSESWFEESPEIDKLVNQFSSFVDGVKVCDMDKALEIVLNDHFEKQRKQWFFHFLWLALWLKSGGKSHEKSWRESFFLAYAIQQDYPLKDIPIMHEIANQSVINSVETMQSRGTHLSKR